MTSEKEDLDVSECYRRLHFWYSKSGHQDILIDRNMKMSRELWELRKMIYKRTDAQLEFLRKLPLPESISIEDIVFVCEQVQRGLLQWAINEKDEHGIEMSYYASHVLDHFSDGLDGQETRNRIGRSKMRLELERKEREVEKRRKSCCILEWD